MPTVVAFDLDGTLTRRDTLLPFLARAGGRRRTALALARASARVALSLRHRDNVRDRAKEQVLSAVLRGRLVTELEAVAEEFADAVSGRKLRHWAIERVQWHLAAGHEVVIVTASPELYVSALGRRLGVHAVLGTRLETDEHGRLTGRLAGSNCRGAEKVARLRSWVADRDVQLVAYGDSSGDTEMLACADVAIRVTRRVPAQPVIEDVVRGE